MRWRRLLRLHTHTTRPCAEMRAHVALRYVAPWCSGAPSGSPGARPCGQLLRFDGLAPHPNRSRNVIGSRMAGARRAAVRDGSVGASEGQDCGTECGIRCAGVGGTWLWRLPGFASPCRSRLYVVADRVRFAASCDTARMGAAAVVPPAGRPRGRSLIRAHDRLPAWARQIVKIVLTVIRPCLWTAIGGIG